MSIIRCVRSIQSVNRLDFVSQQKQEQQQTVKQVYLLLCLMHGQFNSISLFVTMFIYQEKKQKDTTSLFVRFSLFRCIFLVLFVVVREQRRKQLKLHISHSIFHSSSPFNSSFAFNRSLLLLIKTIYFFSRQNRVDIFSLYICISNIYIYLCSSIFHFIIGFAQSN